jgi:ATP-dependent Clp protease ATP-binding subunit ClpA
MTGGLTARLDLARVYARRRQHDSTEPEHLLAVVLEIEEIASALAERGLDPVELRERVEARLAARPAVGGYRDGVDAPLSMGLERVAKHVAASRWIPFARKPTIIDALLLEPAIAALVFELRRGNDYRYVVERARALALMSEHARVEIVHVFRVLLDLRSFIDTIERAGGNTRDLLTAVEATLASGREKRATSAPRLDAPVQELLPLGTPNERSVTGRMSIRQLCLALASKEEAMLLWCTAGIEPSDFIRAVHQP